MRADLLALLEETSGIRWPSEKYRNDPCAFAEEIIGVRAWSRQREILEAVRDHKRVSVRSGHKVSKSHTAGIIALWFYCSFEDARAVFTSVTARQVDAILWREMAKMRSKAGTCVSCRELAKSNGTQAPRPCPHSSVIGGRMATLARSGFRADDFREVVGFTAREAEAVAGISGANLLYIADEASGIPDEIFSAMEGNRAGGARLVMFSNPTRTEGEFFLSHTEKAEKVDPVTGETTGFYRAIHVSSEETPNVIEGKNIIPGLATREWVLEKRAEWGEDSPLYRVRVKGEFALNEDGKILSVHALMQAEERWEETPADGPLHVSCDPAGPGLAGDESAFAVRRGQKIVDLIAKRGLSEEAHVRELVEIVRSHRQEREQLPVVLIDREGPIGSRIYGLLRAFVDQHPHAFVVVGVRSSDRASREPNVYDRVRDELWGNLSKWMRDGGAIPADARLERELHAPSWIGQVNGKLKVTPKSELRKMLDGRSPDRADAVCLAVWQPIVHAAPPNDGERAVATADTAYTPAAIDPYGLDGMGGGGDDGGGVYG